MNTKQVIILRKFKSLRTGKYCAQAAHASLGSYFVLDRLIDDKSKLIKNNWLQNSFRKITLYVESIDELLEIEQQCLLNNIPCKLITDNGTTEFDGVSTITALGIGPWVDEEIDKITKNLKLF